LCGELRPYPRAILSRFPITPFCERAGRTVTGSFPVHSEVASLPQNLGPPQAADLLPAWRCCNTSDASFAFNVADNICLETLVTLVFGGTLDVIDHEVSHRAFLSSELQTQLFSNGGKNDRTFKDIRR
jgi:hypothetical protein